jgi:eukaryotic-like serine/threonine-protein kinase
MVFAAGTRLGPYEILNLLGAGGMGEVYRARDTRLDRIIALKALSTALDPQVQQRFEREARAISSLNHPNICILHDVGLERATGRTTTAGENPVAFLVMEHLEGETLAARLARGPLAMDEAIDVAIQIVSALDCAHRRGIIHRDLKPGNVMLTRPPTSLKGRPGLHMKLLDFGLARLIQPSAAAPETPEAIAPGMGSVADLTIPTMSAPLTMQGTILGTLQYMSPEQLEGMAVDARADIFAFGALLYEMIAGRRPFEGKSQASRIGAILGHDPPSLASLQPATPPLLAELVTRALAKDREERWQSSRDLLRQLEWIAAYRGVATTEAPARESRRTGIRARWVRTCASVSGAAVIGVVTWMLWPKAVFPAAVSRFAVSLRASEAFTRTGRHVLALSPDGSRLTYVANRQLYLRNLNELTAALIPGTENTDPAEPVFSPDGQWLAFWSNSAVRKIAVSGGVPTALSAADLPTGMSWQTGERILVGQGGAGIVEVPANGGSPIRLVALDSTKQEEAQSPQFVGGGRAVLFTLRAIGQAWDDAAIVVQDLASSRRTVLVTGGTDARLAPTGHLIYAHDGTLFAVAFDGGALVTRGVSRAVQPGVASASFGLSGAAQIAFSSSGTFAFVRGRLTRENRLIWVDRRGRVEQPALPERRYSGLRLSPDGTKVAVTIFAETGPGQAGAGQDIWVWDTARTAMTRLTFTSHGESPVWTPDGRLICFNSASEVVCQAADGSGRPQAMFRVNGLIDLSQVSPDGKWLLMVVGDLQKEKSQIVMAPLQSGAQVRPVMAAAWADDSASLSPDGRWLVYESDESGTPQVYVRPFPDISQGRWQISTTGGMDPRWSRNGRELFFVEMSSKGVTRPGAIMSIPVSAGPRFTPAPPTLALKYPIGGELGFAEGADGRFLFIVPPASDEESVSQAQIVVVQHFDEELRTRVRTK